MPKLPRGISRRKDGLLEKRFTANGKRISVYGHTVRELREKEMMKLREIDSERNRSTDCTLDEYFNEWIRQKERVIKPATCRNYQSLYSVHISPEIGKQIPETLTKRDIFNFLEKIEEKSGPTTANSVLTLLKNIFSEMVREGILSGSPAEYIPKRKVTDTPAASETIHRALTRQEQAAFLQALEGEYYREYLEFALLTGMRTGEISGLQWGDIDTKSGVIRILRTQTTDLSGRKTTGSPKTRSSRKEIPLNNAIKGVLERQKTRMRELHGIGALQAEKPVFLSVSGKPTDRSAIGKHLNKVIRKMNDAGVPTEHFGIHALRDTFATRFIENGGNPQILKAVLGHSSLSMTMDLYAHVLPDAKAEEMERISIL